MRERVKQVDIFDSTLRDGAQGEGISFSVEDKLKIVRLLDRLGVKYIEAGNPGSNPKDMEFFKRLKELTLKNSEVVAFGSTRRKNTKVEEDANLRALLDAKTNAVVIFGKAWDFHVTKVLGVSLEENLNMIAETISYLVKEGKEVFFDAEHFYDGFKANPRYALKVLKVAEESGARTLVLCDTNGGSFPDEVLKTTEFVGKYLRKELGIHLHNDNGMAVASTVLGVDKGVTHVQGTLLGIGERCGNVNLSTVISNLELKKDIRCISGRLDELTTIVREVAEITNINLASNTPFVGNSAFSHKAGMHIDGVLKYSTSFEHVDPNLLGNSRSFLTSEISGKNTILKKVNEHFPYIKKEDEVITRLIKRLKKLEFEGYQFEGAEASFKLLILKEVGVYKPSFEIEKFKAISDKDALVSALLKIRVKEREEITAAEGNGPVNALDLALRKALKKFYPDLEKSHLTDYKVRVVNSGDATGAKVRVLIETREKDKIWTTVGVSTDIIDASLLALKDSIEYRLICLEGENYESYDNNRENFSRKIG